jgi:hypothetical protein
VTNQSDSCPIPGVLSLMSRMIFNSIPGIVIVVTHVRVFKQSSCLAKMGYPERWVSLLTGHNPQPRISIFCAGFVATEKNSTGVTWSEVGFKLKTT